MKILKKKDENKFSIIKILTVIGLVLAIVVSGFTIYDRFITEEVLTIEQRLSPDMMKTLKKGETVHIEKGVNFERSKD